MSEPRYLSAEQPAVIAFTGPDAVRFLNGQMTQDVAELGDKALPSCITDAKGKLQFYVTICQGIEDDSIWVVGPAEEAEAILGRLDRYLIADDVEISNLTGQWTLVHSDCRSGEAALVRSRQHIFGEGHDLWFKSMEHPQYPSITKAQAETLRISQAIPAWGKELTEGLLPPEAGLEKTAISYQKGCYIGQEVISRIKTAGKVNRKLARLHLSRPCPEGTLLTCEGQEAGVLTSVTTEANKGEIAALGYIRRKFIDQKTFEFPDGGSADFVEWA